MFGFGKKIHGLTDEELMRLIGKGDRQAFSELYDRYSGPMVKFFYRMLNRDLHKAQDFMQDLFVKLIENPSAFDTNKKFGTWICTVAYNQCKNEYRRNEVRDQYSKRLENELLPVEFPEEQLDRKAFENSLNSSLSQLDEKHSSVFLLRYQQGLSVKEIAEIIECPEGTVKSRLFHAIRNLAESLKIYDPKNN